MDDRELASRLELLDAKLDAIIGLLGKEIDEEKTEKQKQVVFKDKKD